MYMCINSYSYVEEQKSAWHWEGMVTPLSVRWEGPLKVFGGAANCARQPDFSERPLTGVEKAVSDLFLPSWRIQVSFFSGAGGSCARGRKIGRPEWAEGSCSRGRQSIIASSWKLPAKGFYSWGYPSFLNCFLRMGREILLFNSGSY
jgi:hypothetical protein